MFVDHTEIPLWGMRGSQREKKGDRNGRRKIKNEKNGEAEVEEYTPTPGN